ncbi:MAG: XRE family transcriptional regulator [Limnobacter sp.]|uniref:helix-turn-helix domain-containing protein n=1 Tax=Limnobacter sp. TaxID=2003368 RepID=UPI0032ECF98C
MKIETKSAHVTPAGGNVFADLGFSPEQSSVLKANSQRIISEKLAIKNSLMGELAKWIDDNQLKQIEAAEILGVSRPRVSDVINRKSMKFTIDALVDMLARTGKNIQLSVR